MYRNYKVVVNTAAGRRRYMQYLIPFIVSSPVVDRYDIWINTHNGADIEFFKRIAEKYPVVNLVWQPDGVVNGNASINAFYKDCIEPDTIYFKLDDDIIWMEPGLIEKMVEFRVNNPQYFLVSPLVINNSLSTYLLQIEGKIKLDNYYNSYSSHPILWKNGHFAGQLHEWFLNNFLRENNVEDLHIGKKEMGMTRFSINSILWFGDEMAKFSGIVPGDDEEFMSCIYPTSKGMANAWNGDAIVAHFAFFTQREILDRMGILEKYGDFCLNSYKDSKLGKYFSEVQEIMVEIETNKEILESQQSPYRKVAPRKIPHAGIKKMIPESILEFLREKRERERTSGFIKD